MHFCKQPYLGLEKKLGTFYEDRLNIEWLMAHDHSRPAPGMKPAPGLAGQRSIHRVSVDLPFSASGSLELWDVYVSHPSRPSVVVSRRLSLRVEAGQTVALVGASGGGGGESSVLQPLQRFAEASAGDVVSRQEGPRELIDILLLLSPPPFSSPPPSLLPPPPPPPPCPLPASSSPPLPLSFSPLFFFFFFFFFFFQYWGNFYQTAIVPKHAWPSILMKTNDCIHRGN